MTPFPIRISYLLCLFILFVLGCATPYQPAQSNVWDVRGFKDTRLDETRFLVEFEGDVSPRTLDAYLFYRCAELTLRNGYDHFALTSEDLPEETVQYMAQYATRRPNGLGVAATIQLFNGNNGVKKQWIYDATAVKKYLATQQDGLRNPPVQATNKID